MTVDSRTPTTATVVRALMRNREPGWSFTGNLLGISYDRVHAANSLLRCRSVPYLHDADGNMEFAALGVLTDMALGASIRPAAGFRPRMATVALSLFVQGALGPDDLQARSRLEHFDADALLGTSSAHIYSGSQLYATASATFLVTPSTGQLAAMPMRFRPVSELAADAVDVRALNLSDEESAILARAAAVTLQPGESFLQRFWDFDIHLVDAGASGTLTPGLHIGNRVGHVQGGVLFAFAAQTAKCATGEDYRLSSIYARFLRPGKGSLLRSTCEVVHVGKSVVACNVAVIDEQGKTALSAHAVFTKAS